MSIKSQKSLNDECSEIFERSYSVRSASDESLSCEDEDEALAIELMNRMTPAVLSKLRRSFKKNKERNRDKDIDRKVEEVMRAAAAEEGIAFAASAPPPQDTLWLDEAVFVHALDNIFGHHKYTTHAHKLFRLLDPFNTGKVWWRQVVSRLVAVGARKTRSRADVWSPIGERRVKRLEHCKREAIVKLVNIERDDSFCYVCVTKGGRIGIYGGDLELLHSYEVFYHRTGVRHRVRNCWITDAIYMSDVQNLVVSASDRSLTVFDATTLAHSPIYCITGLRNIPTCLAYSPSKHMGESSELAIGSERGDVTRVRFTQPRLQLFYTKAADAINYYFWMELNSPPHSSYVTITNWRRVHSRSVRRMAFTRDGDMLVSCSHDNAVSVRVRHVPGKLDDYQFRVQRGVSCFHAVPPLRLLATGGCDGAVRLWEDTQPTPFAVLQAPTAPHVLDVAVVPAMEIVLAYCNNCTVYIWDMYEECLLQSIKIKFPFLGVLGKKVEFGAYCIFPGPPRKKLEEPSEELQEAPSRRGSSVYQGSTGGLMLAPEPQDDWQTRPLEDDPEYKRFNRNDLLVTCCDFTCVIGLAGPGADGSSGWEVPPPGSSLHARRPSNWDLPSRALITTPSPLVVPTRVNRAPSPRLLAPASAEHAQYDLDTLLENAGLQGILEKDFVLMQGLKHDLNRKLAAMEDLKESMLGSVSMGAPYLALKIHEPEPMGPANEMTEDYRRIMRLFPGSSTIGTPTSSQVSTPRNNRSSKL